MNLAKDYFVHGRAPSDRHPLLRWTKTERARSHICSKGLPLPPSELDPPLQLAVGRPVPKVIEMADHLSMPQPVVTAKIRDVLAPLDLFGVQLVPAEIEVPQLKQVFPYFLIHLHRTIACLDRTRSNLSIGKRTGRIVGVRKLALDEEKLSEISEAKRLMFELDEYISIVLWHRRIVEAIEAVSPTGIRFWPAEGWGESAPFQ